MKQNPFTPARRVYIRSAASVVGEKEKLGPLGDLFDLSGEDHFGKETWEQSEAEMQRLALSMALQKSGMKADDVDAVFAGDLMNQCISSSFGLLDFKIPFLGLFGACSTAAEGLLMTSMALSSYADRCAAVTSSHYCSAERQFRYPLEYGGQRPPTAQWTVTGSGAFIVTAIPADLSADGSQYAVEITAVMPGRIVDGGISDANNMGAAMAPAAADTLRRYFEAGKKPEDYDMILTGDLGREGSAILDDLLYGMGYDITARHADAGRMIYTPDESDTHAGGSGCGCSAVVLAADILPNMRDGRLKNILFLGTGALMNTLSINQKQTIPGIAHLIHLTAVPMDSVRKGQ